METEKEMREDGEIKLERMKDDSPPPYYDRHAVDGSSPHIVCFKYGK
jgi:hypothetical protein